MNATDRRSRRHTSSMRTAHGDITATTVLYAILLGLIVAGRWGWIAVALFAVVVGPLLGYWVARRVETNRKLPS